LAGHFAAFGARGGEGCGKGTKIGEKLDFSSKKITYFFKKHLFKI